MVRQYRVHWSISTISTSRYATLRAHIDPGRSNPEHNIKVEVQDPLAEHVELLKKYTNADMHNILAYLETLK